MMGRAGAEVYLVDEIVVDESVQVRTCSDRDMIEQYRNIYATAQDMEPLTVFKDDDKVILADGFQRLEAAKLARVQKVECWVRFGNIHAARLFAATANSRHGLPLNDGDKKRAILQAKKEWPEVHGFRPSNRELAEFVGCSERYVGKVLEKRATEHVPVKYQQTEKKRVAVLNDLLDGLKTKEIVARHHCSHTLVTEVRQANGLGRKHARRPKRPADEVTLSPAESPDVPLDAFIRSTIAAIEARPVDEHRTVINAITNHFDHKEQKKLAAVELQPVVH